jgi:carbonic anhydrase
LARSSNRAARADLSFKYSEQDKWKDQFPTFCAGMQQSPININLGNCTQLPAGATELTFINWSKIPSKSTVRKTVDTVQLWNDYSGDKPMITGGPVGSDTFAFYQLHFHWGPTGW